MCFAADAAGDASAFASPRGCHRCAVADAAWRQRPALLAVARSRTVTHADAEDVVSEAIARAVEGADNLDPNRVGAWLTTVTINLCTDLARDRARHHKRLRY